MGEKLFSSQEGKDWYLINKDRTASRTRELLYIRINFHIS